MSAKVINGKVYDTNMARVVGQTSSRIKTEGNIPGNTEKYLSVKLLRRQKFVEGKDLPHERFEKGSWSVQLRKDAVEDAEGYFLSVELGYDTSAERIEPVSDEKAYEWACENCSVTDVLREFPGRTEGVDYYAEQKKAEDYFKGAEKQD